MAILLEANYSKKIGLPEYSSHQFSLAVRVEVTGHREIARESGELYRTLQEAVDRELQNPGFVPSKNGNGHGNGDGRSHAPSGNGNGSADWNCSPKQRELILNVIRDNNLDRAEVSALARERFGKPVVDLNKMEASGLIDELLERHGTRGRSPRQGRGRNGAYAGRGAR